MIIGVNSCIKSEKERHSDLKVNSLNINKFSMNIIRTENMKLVYGNITSQFYPVEETGRLEYVVATEIMREFDILIKNGRYPQMAG
jgi:hypothetical protein